MSNCATARVCMYNYVVYNGYINPLSHCFGNIRALLRNSDQSPSVNTYCLDVCTFHHNPKHKTCTFSSGSCFSSSVMSSCFVHLQLFHGALSELLMEPYIQLTCLLVVLLYLSTVLPWFCRVIPFPTTSYPPTTFSIPHIHSHFLHASLSLSPPGKARRLNYNFGTQQDRRDTAVLSQHTSVEVQLLFLCLT